MADIHIRPGGIREERGNVVVSTWVEQTNRNNQSLWYQIPVEHKPALTESCDPFVLGLIFNAMRASADLVVHGQVSPSLLQNLDEFQAAWVAWRPGEYSHIDIVADEEYEAPVLSKSAGVIAFSGGVDSSYSVFRHRTGNGRWSRCDLRAGLMLLGLNLGLDKEDAFWRAVYQGQIVLDSMDMDLIPMVTNLKGMIEGWIDAFGSMVASCLSLLAGGYTYGLISSDIPYSRLMFPWTTNPITNPLMSSDAFQILEDGAAYSRFEKVRLIADWPEAEENLRVCFNPGDQFLNCSRCEKCIRTILSFRAWGLGFPPSFERDVGIRQILQLRFAPTLQIEQYTDIVEAAQGRGQRSAWIWALKLAILRNRLERKLRQSKVLRRLRRLLARLR
jgi:hypothetical protein